MKKKPSQVPLYRLSSMRKRLSVSTQVSCETKNLSVNPVLIVLERLAFARGDVVFIFSFKIFTFFKETGRFLTYFTATVCI